MNLASHYGKQHKDTSSVWKRWLSISGISAIASILIAFPVIESCSSHVRAAYNVEESFAVQGTINTNIQTQVWVMQATVSQTNQKLDDLEKLIYRVLDNQEHPKASTPKMKDDLH